MRRGYGHRALAAGGTRSLSLIVVSRERSNISKHQCSKLGSCSETCPISHRNLPPPINLSRTNGNMALLHLGNITERGYSEVNKYTIAIIVKAIIKE